MNNLRRQMLEVLN